VLPVWTTARRRDPRIRHSIAQCNRSAPTAKLRARAVALRNPRAQKDRLVILKTKAASLSRFRFLEVSPLPDYAYDYQDYFLTGGGIKSTTAELLGIWGTGLTDIDLQSCNFQQKAHANNRNRLGQRYW
jgi:hypothetical protein